MSGDMMRCTSFARLLIRQPQSGGYLRGRRPIGHDAKQRCVDTLFQRGHSIGAAIKLPYRSTGTD
jgi:hypothetical protein